MNILTVCGIGILACTLGTLVRQTNAHWGKMIGVFAGILLMLGSVERLGGQWSRLSALFSASEVSQPFVILGKSLGVALLVETASDICRDSGEEILAQRLLFFGKTEILLLAIPLMEKLIALAQEVMA